MIKGKQDLLPCKANLELVRAEEWSILVVLGLQVQELDVHDYRQHGGFHEARFHESLEHIPSFPTRLESSSEAHSTTYYWRSNGLNSPENPAIGGIR